MNECQLLSTATLQTSLMASMQDLCAIISPTNLPRFANGVSNKLGVVFRQLATW